MADISKKLKTNDEDMISELPDEILTHILVFVDTKSSVATSILSKRWKLVWFSVPTLDLISRLPDKIITHILSFIPTRCSVATGVLSKRWKILWVLVPNLELDFYYKWFGDRLMEEREIHFENFVDRVLSLNNVISVRNVILYCFESDFLRATAWFNSLVIRSAERFYLDMPGSFLVKDGSLTFSSTNLNLFPDSFFNQKNLVELRLTSVVLKVPPLVCLPCLKTINLDVQFFDDKSLKNLLAGCSALTDLCITPKKVFAKQILYICSSTLQNFKVYKGWEVDALFYIAIDAPNVRYLHIRGGVGARYDIINLSSLVEASLFSIYNEKILLKLLKKISHVKKLSLNDCIMNALGKSSLQKLPMFHNLTHLTLFSIDSVKALAVLLRLLPYTPNGVNIFFMLVNANPHCLWFEALNLPQSIIQCIESVRITEKEDNEGMSVIACIYKNATGSKKLIFHGVLIHYIQKDEFLKTFLPVSNESKVNKAFVPDS